MQPVQKNIDNNCLLLLYRKTHIHYIIYKYLFVLQSQNSYLQLQLKNLFLGFVYQIRFLGILFANI